MLKDKSGAALVMVLLVMMVLTVFSVVALDTIDHGINITRDFKDEQVMLHGSDAGIEVGYGFIERSMANDQEITSTDSNNSYLTIETTDADSDGEVDLQQELKGSLGSHSDGVTSSPDIIISVLGDTINMDIDYWKSKRVAGSSSEFSSRYEGIGAGGAGGVGIYYRIRTLTGDPSDRFITLEANFKCIEGGGRCL